MSSAIDFKKLLKLEKQRLRLERKQNCSGEKEVENSALSHIDMMPRTACTMSRTKSNDSEKLLMTKHETSCSTDGLDIYKRSSTTLCAAITQNITNVLNQNRIEGPSSISDVFYIQEFLSPEYEQKLYRWLKSLPHTSDQDVRQKFSRQQEEAQNYNGKWTRLRFSERNVVLFDFSPKPSGDDSSININFNSSTPAQSASVAPAFPSTSQWPLLQRLCDVLVQIKAFPPSHPPNHVLVNEYQVSSFQL